MSSSSQLPQLASTILLLRNEPEFQVLMVKRHHQIDFASDALVFPGGKSHVGDADPDWGRHASGWDGLDPGQRILRVAAIREVFEETGILLAQRRDGSPFAGTVDPGERTAVDRGDLPFLDVICGRDLEICLDALTTFARWITPPVMTKRFDTFFYVAVAPADQIATCDGKEAVDAEWISPRDALRLGTTRERTIIFPTRRNLELLAESADPHDAIARARGRTLVTVEPEVVERDGVQLFRVPPGAGYSTVAEPM